MSFIYISSKPKWKWCRPGNGSMWMCHIGLWCTVTSVSHSAITAVRCSMDSLSRAYSARHVTWTSTSGAKRMWPTRAASIPSKWPRYSAPWAFHRTSRASSRAAPNTWVNRVAKTIMALRWAARGAIICQAPHFAVAPCRPTAWPPQRLRWLAATTAAAAWA